MNSNLSLNDVLQGASFADWLAGQMSVFSPIHVLVALEIGRASCRERV